MSAAKKILDGIKASIRENQRVTIDLREASTLTGSGNGIGGRTQFDEAFAALRYANPFRMGARNIKTPNRSAVQFVAKTGNSVNAATGGWGYVATPNSGSPGAATTTWQLPTRVLSAQLPIRSAVLDDINGLETTVVEDLVLEFGQQEGLSMAINSDQSGSTTATTGATNGLRGLDMYTSAGASAFGTSGTAITNGIHSIATLNFASTWDFMTQMASALPGQYWALPTTAWYITPAMIQTLRQIKDNTGMPIFMELNEGEDGMMGSIFGWPVIVNPYLSSSFPIYLANWDRFLTIADVEEITVQAMEQTQPGTITIYAERRMVSTVRDPFAGVRAAN